MRKLFSTLTLAAMLGLGTAGAATASGPAGGLAPAGLAAGADLVTEVRDCGRWGCRDRYQGGRHYRGDSSRTYRRHWDRNDWRDRNHYRRDYRPSPSFRLYVQPRVIPRYVQPAPVYRLSSAHVAWCHARYRSYRSSDNSWQPYSGPRRSCVSPYR
jgi:hypothetical protein